MYRDMSEIDSIKNMADCLLLLSNTSQKDAVKRVFTCKTCSKEFSSFQALGGHRASHKKPATEDDARPSKPKTASHECPICGLEFAIGQALGGHMRRHRNGGSRTKSSSELSVSPVTMKKSSGGISKRVLCLDLNLTPMENDLKLKLGTMIC